MIQFVEPAEFLQWAANAPVVDVRSPAEFQKGHIPNAQNVPLFDNDERHQVGLTYSENGKDEAVLKGLEFVGPKMKSLAETAIQLGQESTNKTVLLHCWRGGMRSQSVAWLFEQVGVQPVLLAGGYKAYRKYLRSLFERPIRMMVLSGLTGAGKTEILHELQRTGEQVIDLEALANHRGSAFGGIGQPIQPTVEQFENLLGHDLLELDLSRRVWIEDESKKIGAAVIPDEFFEQKCAAPAIFIEIDQELRAQHILEHYGELEPTELISATERITKRFGGQNVLAVKNAISHGDLKTAVQLLLDYYDRSYLLAQSKQQRSYTDRLHFDSATDDVAAALIAAADQILAQPAS